MDIVEIVVLTCNTNSESSNTLFSTIYKGFAKKKCLDMMVIGRVGVGLSLSEPTDLKHCQNRPGLPTPTNR